MFSTSVRICRQVNVKTLKTLCRFSHGEGKLVTQSLKEHYSLVDAKSMAVDDSVGFDKPTERASPLAVCTEDVSHMAPYLKPTFNFAAYVNNSHTLQELVKLGVNLHRLEQREENIPLILGLDFEKDIKDHITFLHDVGIKADEIGAFITKNPLIFKADLDDLQVRINYLQCKKFTNDMILRIITRNPYWLSCSTQHIDSRLGYFQKEFALNGDEVRSLAARQPKLITYSMQHVKQNLFVIKEEMGFTSEEIKSILLSKPNLFMKEQKKLLKTFEYIHNTMKIPLEMIAKVPEVLTCREFRVKERHLFLEALGKVQYDPKKPNYVSILTMVSNDDREFAVNVARSSLQAYNTFLKSL